MLDPDFRDTILAAPEKLLEDRDVMAALVAASEAQSGNVIDLRGIAMQKLEDRLDALEETHRSVIAAAYENLAGTNQINRAILELLDPLTFDDFLAALSGNVAEALKVDAVGLLLETTQSPTASPKVLRIVTPGTVGDYISGGRNVSLRPVVLRQCMPDNDQVYGEAAAWVRSEALMRLDFGTGRLPGLLALGSEDPHHFKPTHGTDLLGFFAGVFERTMRRWLS
ncbi:MAG: DUF484 family protein [Cypionkella sp.]|nr:DUF484 family protein [Cypionkella sp.]